MLNFIKSFFYSKETKEVNEIFPSKPNILNCNSSIEFDGTIFFNGKVNGDLICKFLKSGSNSIITGNVNADWVFVLGEIQGDINANRVAIGPSAKVHGKISYNSISIEPGATILGNYFKRNQA
jgi:cytoskeletal protein CcmA (bactofilin family)